MFVILVGAAVFAGLYFWQARSSSFGKLDRFNILLFQDPVTVLSLDIKRKSATAIFFPGDVQVTSAHGYGRLPVGSLYKAGDWDSQGSLVAKDTISDLLGMPIDLVLLETKPLISPTNLGTRWAFLDYKKLTKDSIFDWLNIAWAWMQIRSDKISVVDLNKYSSEIILADGNKAKTFDQENFDLKIGDKLAQSSVVSESFRTAVINSTDVNGLGAQASRFLINQGVNLVSTDSQKSLLSACEAQYSNPAVQTSKTAWLVVEYFHCRLVKNTDLDNRFDLVVILGDDFAKRFIK